MKYTKENYGKKEKAFGWLIIYIIYANKGKMEIKTKFNIMANL